MAIRGDRIVAVGETKEVLAKYHATKEINAQKKVVMPGLIDGHAHAGHALLKSTGTDIPDAWNDACFQIYQKGSDPEFWFADGLLGGLERLKCGTTTSINLLGGGDEIMRTDFPIYGEKHCEAIKKIGIREFLAVGPGKPPFPKSFSQWNGHSKQEIQISFEQQLETCEELILRWHGKANGRIRICLSFPTPYPGRSYYSDSELENLKWMADKTEQLRHKHGSLITMDGHSRGTIKFTYEELSFLGPDAILSHSIDITAEEIELCKKTQTNIAHNPSAIKSILGRCPVPELLDAGVTVLLGSDGVAPDRSYDMFRHMYHCMRYHRTYFRDPAILPPGKVLEMATIDAAKALGLDHEIGSLEAGKKADIILIDLHKPHLYPLNMPLYRVMYFASGSDVDTVIVDGNVLMENRRVNTVDEDQVLEQAQSAAERALDRSGLRDKLGLPDKFWGNSRYD